MTGPAFTVLLPVHRPPALMRHAVNSVLAQERRDFELFIICDGAPPETVSSAEDFAARDDRIRVFSHPKGERCGEIYRDQALRNARGAYVCQIGDDDLWLPNHLAEMEILLRDVDFGNLWQVEPQPDGQVIPLTGDLNDAATREHMLTENYNFFGPTVAGYRLSAYRALAVGWSPAPPDLPTDLYMWRKFLAHGGLRFGTRIATSSLKFPTSARSGWTMEQRAAEMAAWAEKISDPGARDAVAQSALSQLNRVVYAWHGIVKEQERLRAKLRATRGSLSWRLTRPFRKLARVFRRRAV